MRAIVQRVNHAQLTVEGEPVAKIGIGLVVLAGIYQDDTDRDRVYIAEKTANLRIFQDEAGKMNLSVLDVRGEVLLVPNFTVAGSTRKGRRPSFDRAMAPDRSRAEFDRLAADLAAQGVPVKTGVFGAHMHVLLENDGPVTLVIDSREA
ncbi:MAG: D-tyrosyl-tRNA(Tyr) deacylase [Phycisphaerales bacterium]|nr:MAG: D-tyrosyl-tRNA(Tyr) deacylase [Phycisphaerales bacterium]